MKQCKYCGEKDINKLRKHFDKKLNRIITRNECNECRNKRRRLKRELKNNKIDENIENLSVNEQHLVDALLEMCQFNKERLIDISEDDFFIRHEKSKEFSDKLNLSFSEIKKKACRALTTKHGQQYPSNIQFKQGIYLIVGDSHGKHTKHITFDLLRELNDYIGFTKIIHIGHILDDDDEVISYRWNEFDNLTVVSKKEEIRPLVKHINKHSSYKFDIIRDQIKLGNLVVRNQDIFTNEYTKTSIGNLDQRINSNHILTNFHKHEMMSKTTEEDNPLLYMGVGCLCEPFVVETRRAFDWLDGRRTKEVYSDSYMTYRRRAEMASLWEQGIYIVEVDENNNFTVIPYRIRNIDKETRGIAFFNKVVTNKGVVNSDTFNLIIGDVHAPKYNQHCISLIDNIARNYQFDNLINLGDICKNQSLNHHEISRKNIRKYNNCSLLYEYGCVNSILERMINWADKHYLIFANHERFTEDFINKWPQFEEILNIRSLLNLDYMGINLIELKQSLLLDGGRYLHGDIKGYGIGGKLQDKLSKIYNGYETPIFIGHIHYPSIRSGCYSVGLLADLDQDYNEPMASNWIHGFGLTTSYRGITWNTTIPILNVDNLLLDGVKYNSAENLENWKLPINIKYNVKYNYYFL